MQKTKKEAMPVFAAAAARAVRDYPLFKVGSHQTPNSIFKLKSINNQQLTISNKKQSATNNQQVATTNLPLT
ncbi:hypothetical protein [Rufibacter roseus]|uniref:Uncharacterized protein n=1 Tax=Rufibacter roseus TaxID=1567108 RepID=A0ABW2DJP9_9BACT|nr:hypothetical protein [Rufibacter roseus]